MEKVSLYEYSRPIYEAWDRRKLIAPPKGYKSWMEYREVNFKQKKQENKK